MRNAVLDGAAVPAAAAEAPAEAEAPGRDADEQDQDGRDDAHDGGGQRRE